MRNFEMRDRHTRALLAGAAGMLLGVPLTLTAVSLAPLNASLGADGRIATTPHNAVAHPQTTTPAQQVAPAGVGIQPVAAETPVPSSQNPAQFRQQYESEVQRQLQLLYLQENRPMPQMPAPQNSPNAYHGGSGKMRLRDWFNPKAWMRQFSRRHRPQPSPAPAPAAAPADVQLGDSIPLVPSVPGGAPQVATDAVPAVDANSTFAAQQPATPPAGDTQRPQLPRVTPEIFNTPGEPEAGPIEQTAPSSDLAATEAEQPSESTGQQPRLLFGAPAASEAIADQAPESGVPALEPAAPQLVTVPEPEQPAEPVPAEAGPLVTESDDAETAWQKDVADTDAGTPGQPRELPTTAGDEERLDAAVPQTEPAELAQPEAEALADESPFVGPGLEPSPFVDPQESTTAPEPSEIADTPTPSVGEPQESVSLPTPEEVADTPMASAAEAEPRTAEAVPEPAIEAPVAAQPPMLTAPSDGGTAPVIPAELPLVETGRPLQAATPSMPASPASAADTGETQTASAEVQEKMARIAARKGLTGFKGFCPVMLHDYRELVDARLEHTTVYEGQQYWFSSEAAKQTFLQNPEVYVPAAGGADVVQIARTGSMRPGSLDHAVWYRGRLFLFESAETKAAFVAAPEAHCPAN